MYSSQIVEQRLGLAQREMGFAPAYHKVSEVDDFNRQLETKYADDYQAAKTASQGTDDPTKAFQLSITRALCNPQSPRLTKDEVRFMVNERAVCTSDAAYFMTRYYWIKTPRGIIRFTFLPGQMVYFNVICEMERRGAPIEMIVCKARQHGISTETEGLALHRISFNYGVNAVIASADRKMTQKMGQMTFLGYDRIPWWLRPISTRRVEADQGMLVFGGQESGVSFQHGNQVSGIARGDTVKIYHLSEVASYNEPEQLIEASLFKCVHAYPDVLGVLESTAEGDTGWFHDTYWHSKKEWLRNRSRLCALFLPWFVGTDKYPTETWIRTRPVPEDWRPMQETRAMAARGQMYLHTSPVLEKVLGENWEMPREQQWFWEVNYLEHKAKGREKLWFQEMPTDDKEAFQGSYDSVFGREVIASAWTQRTTRYDVYGIIGQSVEDRHEPNPEDVDYSAERLSVKYESRRAETYRWEFVPLQWIEPFEKLEEIRDDETHMGKLFVYLKPEPGYDYSIGVDTSKGIGEDGTAIAVCRRARGQHEQDEQAAEFRSNLVSHVDAYAFVIAIAAYYSRYMTESTRYREPYVAIEQIAAVGDTCQLQMSKMGYGRFHQMIRYDSKPSRMKKSKAVKRGWFTSGWSRPLLTDGFVTFVQNGWYKVNSPYTLSEMDHWEVHLTAGGKEKFEHSADFTDDGVFANAMAAFCPNDLKSLTERAKQSWHGPTGGNLKKPMLNIAPPSGGQHFEMPTGGMS